MAQNPVFRYAERHSFLPVPLLSFSLTLNEEGGRRRSRSLIRTLINHRRK